MIRSRVQKQMPLIPALGTQRQGDLWEFNPSLVYRVSSRTGRAAEKPCLEKPVMIMVMMT